MTNSLWHVGCHIACQPEQKQQMENTVDNSGDDDDDAVVDIYSTQHRAQTSYKAHNAHGIHWHCHHYCSRVQFHENLAAKKNTITTTTVQSKPSHSITMIAGVNFGVIMRFVEFSVESTRSQLRYLSLLCDFVVGNVKFSRNS